VISAATPSCIGSIDADPATDRSQATGKPRVENLRLFHISQTRPLTNSADDKALLEKKVHLQLKSLYQHQPHSLSRNPKSKVKAANTNLMAG
jgi:hypothetical protein